MKKLSTLSSLVSFPTGYHLLNRSVNSCFRQSAFARHFNSAMLVLIAGSATTSANAQQEAEATKKVSAEQTQKVEVHAAKPVQSTNEKISLTGEELFKMPGSGGDPLKALQTMPGMATNNDGDSGAAVRGARPSDNAYYVDFLPVGYLFHMGGFVSVFNADLIRRFDLYSAAWSPQYGDVIGGVFDASLRNPRTDRIGGKIRTGALDASVLLEGPLSDNTSFFLSARRSVIDLFVKEIKDEKAGTSFTFPSYSDVQGRFLWNIDSKNRLRFDLSTAQDRIKFNLKKESIDVQHDPILLGESAESTSFNNMAVVLESDLGAKTSNQVALGQMVTHQKSKIGNAGAYASTSTLKYLREQVTTNIFDNHQVIAGVDLSSNTLGIDVNVKNPRCTEFDPNCDATSADYSRTKRSQRANSAAAYVNDRWRLSPQWTLTGGLRATRDDYLKENVLDPRLGLEYSYSPQTVFSVGLGQHHQEPSREQSLSEIGNPYLKSIRSKQVVFGVTQNLEQGWSWRAEVYKKDFDHFVVSDPLQNYRNGASGSAQGLEVLVKKDMGYGLSGFVSVSVSKSKRRNDLTGENFTFGFDQPVIANAVLQYKASEKLQYGARWSYHTGHPDTPIVGTRTDADGRIRPIYGALNSERMPAYHRLDLRVDYQYSDKLSYYAELINAYARRNVGSYEYSADYKSRKPEAQMPIFPSIGMQYKF
ncbi:TonB-dependent receptor plug domain-containing protein [Undibacterium flavidum]|uniref:TonB-dependent receptor n=1 Tax=Undibacterium flavidum TaxID=2762297 RepID=A0ABR6Y7V7_9BURK|nr:TonB-dependent receptor [Undibacterium flavidum]MBC3872669.1 TonB-dependent receptor [Undibacterium flavidum]